MKKVFSTVILTTLLILAIGSSVMAEESSKFDQVIVQLNSISPELEGFTVFIKDSNSKVALNATSCAVITNTTYDSLEQTQEALDNLQIALSITKAMAGKEFTRVESYPLGEGKSITVYENDNMYCGFVLDGTTLTIATYSAQVGEEYGLELKDLMNRFIVAMSQ